MNNVEQETFYDLTRDFWKASNFEEKHSVFSGLGLTALGATITGLGAFYAERGYGVNAALTLPLGIFLSKVTLDFSVEEMREVVRRKNLEIH